MLCPICNKRECHKKIKKVKDGYSKKRGKIYLFVQTGWRTVVEEYWTCKKCTKLLSAERYNMKLVEVYNSGKFH